MNTASWSRLFGTNSAQRAPSTDRALPDDDLILFTRQLATLIQAGLPLLQALDIVRQHRDRTELAALVRHLQWRIENGLSLSAALSRHPQAFGTHYCRMVAVGESSGLLDEVLLRLATHLEAQRSFRKRMGAALAYPMVVSCTALAVLLLLMLTVVPTFKDVFAGLGAELPAATRWVLQASEALMQWGPWGAGFMVATGLGLRRALHRSNKIKARAQRWALRVPLAGPLWRRIVMARWTRTLASLLNAGLPLIEALGLVASSCGHAVVEQATHSVQQSVAGGHTLTEGLRASGAFEEMVLRLVSVGEQAGTLAPMLQRAAELLDEEVSGSLQKLSTLLEPALLIVVSSVIGALVLALYLPIFRIGSLM